jgi:hypothetical protein
MNRQQIFETVARHLFAQGKRAVKFNESAYHREVAERIRHNWGGKPDKEEYQTCQYRSPDGLKCAVGCLIPDEYYDVGMEGNGVYSILSRYPLLKKLLDVKNVMDDDNQSDDSLLSKLQNTHDNKEYWETSKVMRDRLLQIAHWFNLDGSFLSELRFQDR